MIKILKNGRELTFKEFVFPGGEVGIKLNVGDYRYQWDKADYQTIVARIQKSEDFLKLAMVKDALERFDPTPVRLFLPYLPYGRQDRVCDAGESFSLKVFCNLLNGLKFKQVIICDPHSEVSPALIDNVVVISQFDIINKWLDFVNRIKGCVLVAPDSGSNKKTSIIAGYLNHDNFVRADKLRDLTNGNIKETIVYCEDFKGRDVVIADDLCDGGRTFIELAKVCKAKNCGKFILYVTHGIFSKGVVGMDNYGIDEIWTTDAFRTDIGETDKIHVLKLEEKFLL